MQRYDAIENGIASKDIKALREAIGSICYTCRDFSNGEFDSVVRYVESKSIKIKDESLIGDPPISSIKNTFTDEDFAKAVFELKKNFCDERINDVKSIGKKLYASKDTIKVNDAALKTVNVVSSDFSKGTNPNVQSHQQNSSIIPVIIGVVAVILIVVLIVLLGMM